MAKLVEIMSKFRRKKMSTRVMSIISQFVALILYKPARKYRNYKDKRNHSKIYEGMIRLKHIKV